MPRYEHRGAAPSIDPTAWIAPNAVVCGDVTVGPGARVLFGAVLSAEDGRVVIGRNTVVMDNAVLRGRLGHPTELGDDVVVGPQAHVNGVRAGDGCFLATGCALFPGAVLGDGVEVRIGAVVQVNTVLAAGAVVPIGWVAVGDPAQLFPPDRHEEIWAVQRELDFSGTVYGITRDTSAADRMAAQSAWYGAHRADRQVEEPPVRAAAPPPR